ncbi:hypothetical protein ACU5P1_18915 [Pseudomonas plecoglossicida]|uniref:hypothetical protein n=1 Tax=Pseudomonas plecoglossicida TaxID=70775 RepID=UPI0011827F53|nr:hypothetical protein [Pseudomonas plecoglossicida]QLB56696.1 hypothetical protein HAV28_18730 [Pseudomonas plecoglossicida]WIU81162.1 hypothetical protein [Pseudomonas plecoglossicida]GLR38166.1 hypothetical protein GCM10011247_35640 [Pseudomonas plecoglossicida]
MPSMIRSVVIAALFAPLPIWAQSTQLADQVITPSAFLGVELQGNFMAEVPECAAAENYPSEPCRIATTKLGTYEIRGLPYLPIPQNYKLFATVTDQTVSQLVLTGNASNLYLVKEMLTDKLGEPATSASHWVKLNSGACYETEAYKWITQGVSVNFGRNLSDLGRYSITFSSSIIDTNLGQNGITPPSESPTL